MRFTLSPFSSESMAGIGEVMLRQKLTRISQAVNSTDGPAKALKPAYAKQKSTGRLVSLSGATRYRGLPIRDWRLRGWTLAAAKVKSANENQVTIGFTNPQAELIVTSLRRRDEMWSDSPNDMLALYAIIRATLKNQVRVVRSLLIHKST